MDQAQPGFLTVYFADLKPYNAEPFVTVTARQRISSSGSISFTNLQLHSRMAQWKQTQRQLCSLSCCSLRSQQKCLSSPLSSSAHDCSSELMYSSQYYCQYWAASVYQVLDQFIEAAGQHHRNSYGFTTKFASGYPIYFKTTPLILYTGNRFTSDCCIFLFSTWVTLTLWFKVTALIHSMFLNWESIICLTEYSAVVLVNRQYTVLHFLTWL